MNISPHLLIDAVILSMALTITLLLRAKGNSDRKEKESKWLLKKKYPYINNELNSNKVKITSKFNL